MKKLILFLFVFSLLPVAQAQEATNFTSRGKRLTRTLVKKDLGQIWAFVFLSPTEVLMTEKRGKLLRLNLENKQVQNISGLPKTAVHGQGGLMEVALSPDFAKDKIVYLTYAKETKKGEYTTALGFGELEGNTLKNFKEIFAAEPSSNSGQHFGGRLIIDSGDSIWLTVGERGERSNAQTLSNHLGKLLRLTKQGKPHPENPFLDRKDAKPEIYNYGLRNPQGLFRHPETQEIWEQEHGPRGGDEINIMKKGVNYGWPVATYGREYWGPKIGATEVKDTEQPIYHWTPSIAPCGFVYYNSDLIPQWKGLIFSGALVLTHLNIVEFKGTKFTKEERLFEQDKQRVRAVQVSPKGELFYSTDEGYLYKIGPA